MPLIPCRRFVPCLAALLALVLLTLAAPALLRAAPTDRELTEHQIEALWKRYWKACAERCMKVEDGFGIVPRYDRRYPSSRGIRTFDFIRENKKTIRYRFGASMWKTESLTPPPEEAEAAAESLPKIEVGQYGKIHSAEIVEVVGPEEMIVEEVWLVDADQLRDLRRDAHDSLPRDREQRDRLEQQLEFSFRERERLAEAQREMDDATIRVLGFDTKGLAEKQRWKSDRQKQGIHLAIVAEEQTESRRSRFSSRKSNRLIAVPIDWVHQRSLDEDQFLKLLESCGHDKVGFAEMAYQFHKRSPGETVERTLLQLIADREEVMEEEAEEEGRDSRGGIKRTWRKD